MNAPIHVLYHAHCNDGFGAALVAWLVFGSRATYTALSYGDPMPEIPDGSAVYLLDISHPDERHARQALEQLATRCEVRVLDHHATAEAALAGLPFAKFEKDKSGAVMAWEWFRDSHPEIICGEVPELLQYVQDRDLWRWELEFSREVNAGLSARPREWAEWTNLINWSKAGIAQLREEGKIVLRVQAQLIESICARVQMEDQSRFSIVGPGLLPLVPVVNTPVLQSEACSRLLELYPGAPYAVAYFEQGYYKFGAVLQRVWSLRSRGEVDVSAIAKAHGGGGHHNAAGFTQTFERLEQPAEEPIH